MADFAAFLEAVQAEIDDAKAASENSEVRLLLQILSCGENRGIFSISPVLLFCRNAVTTQREGSVSCTRSGPRRNKKHQVPENAHVKPSVKNSLRWPSVSTPKVWCAARSDVVMSAGDLRKYRQFATDFAVSRASTGGLGPNDTSGKHGPPMVD
jgi:hypothetical protein